MVEPNPRDPLVDTNPTGDIPGLKEALAEGEAPVVLVDDETGTKTIIGRATVLRRLAAEPALVMPDDAERHDGSGRMLKIAAGLGLAAAVLTAGVMLGVSLVPRYQGGNAAPGQVPGTGTTSTAELSPSASPTAKPSATPTPKPSTSAAASANPAAATTGPVATTANTVPAPNYEGKIVVNSLGQQEYIKGGKAYPIANAAVSICVSVRSGAGAPVSVPNSIFQGYPQSGVNAHCAYETQTSPGRLNFVTEDGGWVWLVDASGVRHHVGSLCSTVFTGYAYEVHQVPVGETDGHRTGSDWFADDGKCAALPH